MMVGKRKEGSETQEQEGRKRGWLVQTSGHTALAALR